MRKHSVLAFSEVLHGLCLLLLDSVAAMQCGCLLSDLAARDHRWQRDTSKLWT